MYKKAMEGLAHDTMYIPEPIAIYKSLLYYNILQKNTEPLLIVDIGGEILQSTILQNGEIIQESNLSIGSNILRQGIVSLLIQSFYSMQEEKDLNDNLALQRLHDAADIALLDLTNKNRTNISLPFLSLESDGKTPKHLDMDVSLDVLIQQVNSMIQSNNLIPKEMLSTNLPQPHNLSTLLSSYMMKTIFEKTNGSITPFQLHKIVMVGGTSKSPIYKKALRDCFGLLGVVYDDRILFVSDGKGDYECDELCAVGAVLCGSDD